MLDGCARPESRVLVRGVRDHQDALRGRLPPEQGRGAVETNDLHFPSARFAQPRLQIELVAEREIGIDRYDPQVQIALGSQRASSRGAEQQRKPKRWALGERRGESSDDVWICSHRYAQPTTQRAHGTQPFPSPRRLVRSAGCR